MFDPPLFLTNGALCAAAFGFAAFVRVGRAEAVVLAGLLGCNFVFCALAYTPYAPKYALQAAGIPLTSKDLWMLADALYGAAAIIIGFWRRWAWALWGMAVVQVSIHAAYLAGLFGPDTYSDRLQNVLHAQLAVFFIIGGPGVVDYLLDTADRLSRYSRRAQAATRRTEQDWTDR